MNDILGFQAQLEAQAMAQLQNGGYQSYQRNGSGKTAVFYDYEVSTGAASNKAGYPQFILKPHVKIFVTGQPQPLFEGMADGGHIAEFSREWEAYKAGKQLEAEGLPLYQWPHPKMTKGQVEVARRANIFTLEQLAGADKGWVMELGPEWDTIHRDAVDYMKRVKDEAPGEGIRELRAELNKRDAEIVAMQEQLEEMSQRFCQITGTEYKPSEKAKPKARKR